VRPSAFVAGAGEETGSDAVPALVPLRPLAFVHPLAAILDANTMALPVLPCPCIGGARGPAMRRKLQFRREGGSEKMLTCKCRSPVPRTKIKSIVKYQMTTLPAGEPYLESVVPRAGVFSLALGSCADPVTM